MLAENGAAVVLVARRADRLGAVKARIEQAGGRAIAVEADVRDRAAMTAAFDAAERAFGTVTILVNNAGVVHSGRAVEIAKRLAARALNQSRRGVLLGPGGGAAHAGRRQGRRHRQCRVDLGMNADNGVAGYSTAKAGVIQLTKSLAIELAFKGIRVNAIAPGWIVTDINREYLSGERGAAMKRQVPMGRFGEERDLDGPLLLLVSDAGRFMTGTTVVADGGQVVALRI